MRRKHKIGARYLNALPLILHNNKLDYYYHKCTIVQVIHSNILPLVKLHEETIPQSRRGPQHQCTLNSNTTRSDLLIHSYLKAPTLALSLKVLLSFSLFPAAVVLVTFIQSSHSLAISINTPPITAAEAISP